MPQILLMNWDWDKLQEKRRHQPGGFQGKGNQDQEDKNSRHDEKPPYQDERQEEDEDFFGFGGRGNNNNDNRRNRTPFGQRPDPRQMMNNVKLPHVKWIVLVLVVLWLGTGIFIVQPDEAGVVLRFGAYNRTLPAGLHYHLPFPIETVTKPKVTQERQIIVGQATDVNQFGRVTSVGNDEGSMLTGDENIVNIQFTIRYYIKPDGIVDYLFNVAEPDVVVKKAAESAMREVIGRSKKDDALTTGRNHIQTAVETSLQKILDSYRVGIQIVGVQMQSVQPPAEVSDAFKDVASAREDKERLTNQAQAYRSDILPKAQGSAAEKVNQAEAYKQTRIRNAEGEATRFAAIVKEYNKAQDVTKKRLFLETMEEILSKPNIDLVILPDNVSGQVLPFLPLGATPGYTAPQAKEMPMNTNDINNNVQNSTTTRPVTRGTR